MKVFSNESKTKTKNTSLSNSFMGAKRKSPLDCSATKAKDFQPSHVMEFYHF